MSKSDAWENQLLALLFNNTPVALVGDAAGLPGSAVAGSLYLSLHTADPGEAGTQLTNEIAYIGYARVAVPRTTAGFTVLNNAVRLTTARNFPTGTGGTGTANTFGIGASATGAGKLLYSGTLTPFIICGNGVTPQITAAAGMVTED